jgi:hypothetical protein
MSSLLEENVARAKTKKKKKDRKDKTTIMHLNETPDMAVCRGVAAAATVAAEKLISPAN